jgi:hypothetical protein
MDMGLEKVATQKELREYFNRPANTRQNQVVFTGGNLDRNHARENANGPNKFIIRLEGEYGNRVATFVRIKPAGARTDVLEESNSAGSWFDSVKTQMMINEPYWRKFNQALTAAQWQQQEAEMETACNNLQSALKTHGRMFLAAEIQAHISKTGQNELISLTMAACETLRIPLQCVVEGEPAMPVSAAVTAFRTMDLGLPTFEEPNEVVKYFAGKPAGTQAVLTKGPRSHRHAYTGIKQRGAIATLEGEYGNRVATLLKMFGGRLAQIQDWESTGRDLNDDRFLISKQKDQLKSGGPEVYVEGSYGTIIRQLKKYFGPGSCSVLKTADRKGWLVTLKRVTKDAESSQPAGE